MRRCPAVPNEAKCWLVEAKHSDDCVYVLAPTEGQAKAQARADDHFGALADAEWVELKARRARQFDGGFTIRDLMERANVWWTCLGCGQKVDHRENVWDDQGEGEHEVIGAPVFDGAGVYCTAECRTTYFTRTAESIPEPQPEARMTSCFLSNEW